MSSQEHFYRGIDLVTAGKGLPEAEKVVVEGDAAAEGAPAAEGEEEVSNALNVLISKAYLFNASQ